MRKIIISAASAVSLLTPFVVGAQNPNVGYFTSILSQVQGIVTTLIPFMFALAFLFFLFGLVKFMFSAGNEDAKDNGRRIMIWGIVILFVMVAVWGIVNLVVGVTGIGFDGAPTQPTAPGGNA